MRESPNHIMNNKDIKGYRRALKAKAAEFDETLDEYMEECAVNGSVIILDQGVAPIYWGDDKYDFVVYEDGEADEDLREGDVIVDMYDWLEENGIYVV